MSLYVKFNDDRCKGKGPIYLTRRLQTDGRRDRRTGWFQYTPNFVAGDIMKSNWKRQTDHSRAWKILAPKIPLPPESRLTRGTKWFSRSDVECSLAMFRSDSTALSRTTVSSTVARLSRGGWNYTGKVRKNVSLVTTSTIHFQYEFQENWRFRTLCYKI